MCVCIIGKRDKERARAKVREESQGGMLRKGWREGEGDNYNRRRLVLQNIRNINSFEAKIYNARTVSIHCDNCTELGSL